METAGIHARRNHLGTIRLEPAVTGILLIRFLAGAGDHQIGMGQGELLGINAPADRKRLLDLIVVSATGEQAAQLFAAQRMACKNKGNSQAPTNQCSHIASVGVVGVNPVRAMLRLLQTATS